MFNNCVQNVERFHENVVFILLGIILTSEICFTEWR